MFLVLTHSVDVRPIQQVSTNLEEQMGVDPAGGNPNEVEREESEDDDAAILMGVENVAEDSQGEEEEEEPEEGVPKTRTTMRRRKSSLPGADAVVINPDLLKSDFEKLSKTLILDDIFYELLVPAMGNTIMDAPEHCFPIYTQVIDMGVRLPLISFI